MKNDLSGSKTKGKETSYDGIVMIVAWTMMLAEQIEREGVPESKNVRERARVQVRAR